MRLKRVRNGHIVIGIATTATAVGLATPAMASNTVVPIYDGFNYPSSTTLGADGSATNPVSWFEESPNTGPDIQVTNSGLSFSSAGYSRGAAVVGNAVALNGAGNTGNAAPATGNFYMDGDRIDVNNGGQLTSGTVYYSYLLNLSGAPSSESIISGFSPGTGNGQLTQILGGLLVKDDGLGTGYELAVAQDNGGNSASQYGAASSFTNSIAYGTSAFVVVSYQVGVGDYSIYLDPQLGLSTAPTATVSIPASAGVGYNETGNVGTFFLAQDQNLGSAIATVDEVRIGTTFASVDPVAVPEPASLSVLALGTGFLLRRRRK